MDRQLADTIVKLNNLQKSNQNILDQQTSLSSQLDKNGQLTLHSNNSSISQQNSRNDNSKPTNMTEKQVLNLYTQVMILRQIFKSNIPLFQVSEIESDLEEHKELSASRLIELEKLNTQYQNSLKQIEKLKADVIFFIFYRLRYRVFLIVNMLTIIINWTANPNLT